MPRRVKKKSHEKLTDTNVQHVLELLKDDNPITKKEACSILNISYNTTRLTNIIDEYLERLDYKNKRKAQNKGKPAREDEIKRVIEDYLDGDSIIEIAAHIFRSPSFVKGIIDRVGVPQRASVEQMKKGTPILPEACIAEEFEVGEVVWCPQYNAAAEVVKEHKETFSVLFLGFFTFRVVIYSGCLMSIQNSAGFSMSIRLEVSLCPTILPSNFGNRTSMPEPF